VLDPAYHARLEHVFRDVFDDDSIVLTPAMTAQDVEGWNSLEHINLIIAVEREFRIKFATSEIVGLMNVGDFESIIARKSAEK